MDLLDNPVTFAISLHIHIHFSFHFKEVSFHFPHKTNYIWYNVRKGQSQVSERAVAELARADVRLDI